MPKIVFLSTTALLLAGCFGDPTSPFYVAPPSAEDVAYDPNDPTDVIYAPTEMDSIASEVAGDGAENPDVASGTPAEIVDAPVISAPSTNTNVVAATAPTVGAGQCLTSDVLANTTFTVVQKGTQGSIVKSGGKEYFEVKGTKHDFTNVPYTLLPC